MSDDDDTIVGGRYLLGSMLGRGGMAEVHEGYDQRLGRPVAVKQLSAHLAADPDAHVRFDREAHAAARLNHPAIASVYDTGGDADPDTGVVIPFIVMELVDGETLRALLHRTGPLPAAQALTITAKVLGALQHSHTAGIIHRDIKPSNVMLTAGGEVKVMDFGIARAIDDTSNRLTQGAAVIGTAPYLSPEQASGRPVDPRSDLYSVGCLMYELLTGRPPFVGDSPIAVAYQHVQQEAAPPSTINPAITPALDAIVMRALAKNPDDRYATAAQMQREVDELTAGADRLPAAAPVDPDPTVVATTTVVRPSAAPRSATRPLPIPAVIRSESVEEPRQPGAAAGVDPDGRRRGGAGRIVLAVLAAVVVISVGILALTQFLPDDNDQTKIAVPGLTGQKRAAAEAALRQLGLEADIEEVRGKAGKSVGTVTGQNPGPGTEVPSGATVTLEVNVGPADATIPKNLVGQPVEDAQEALEALGFTKVKTRAVTDQTGTAEAGDVLSVKPDEGEKAALDEVIVLRYARAARPAQTTDATAPSSTEPSSSPTSEPTKTKPPTADPSTSPTRTDEPSQSTKPTATPSATKKVEPTKKPKPTKTPKHTKTPKPPKTPKPTKTPKPVEDARPGLQ